MARQAISENYASIIVGATFIFQYHPVGPGPILLDSIVCSGSEQSLLGGCSHSTPNQHRCGMFENVGLFCQKMDGETVL